MIELKRANHCVYKIRYHMVLVLKYRKKLLYGRDRIDHLMLTLEAISERYDIEFDTIGTDGDHMHVFVGGAPRYAPSKIMQIIKSITAREMLKKFDEIKEVLWGGEFWSDGGYIGTVGEGANDEIIRKYIEKQGTPEEQDAYKQMTIKDFFQPPEGAHK
jgi:putative transposase